MSRRSILSTTERESLLALPDTEDELIRHYTFSAADLSLIRQRRGEANRLGFAVQLCLLHHPGQGLLPDAVVPMSLLEWVGRQLRLDTTFWPQYAEREETRREHLLELRPYLGLEPLSLTDYRQAVQAATELALQTDKGIVLATNVIDAMRQRHDSVWQQALAGMAQQTQLHRKTQAIGFTTSLTDQRQVSLTQCVIPDDVVPSIRQCHKTVSLSAGKDRTTGHAGAFFLKTAVCENSIGHVGPHR